MIDDMIQRLSDADGDKHKLVALITDVILKIHTLNPDMVKLRYELKRSEMIYDVNKQSSMLAYLDKGWKVTDARARCELDSEADRGAMLEHDRLYHECKAEVETYEHFLALCMKLLGE